MEASGVSVGQDVYGGEVELAELHFRTFRLDGDLALPRGAFGAVVHEVAVDPYLDLVVEALDYHAVPIAGFLLRTIGQVEDAAGLALGDSPVLLGTSARRDRKSVDVLHDAPEVPRVLVVHLYLDRLREHLVKGAWLGGVHQNPTVARLAREAVFHLEAVVLVHLVVHQVAAGGTEAHQHAVAGHEGHLVVGVFVEVRDVHLPARQILAVE